MKWLSIQNIIVCCIHSSDTMQVSEADQMKNGELVKDDTRTGEKNPIPTVSRPAFFWLK